MSEATTESAPSSTPSQVSSAPAQAAPAQSAPPASSSSIAPAKSGGFDFVPEKLRGEGWVNKYDTAEKFWDGVANTHKMVGQKQVVNGLIPPGEGATDDDWGKFFTQLGRPESFDKYELPDLQLPEGYDIESERREFLEAAHEANLHPKQATKLYEKMVKQAIDTHIKSEAETQKSFESALKTAFPADQKTGFDLAKRGAKALGIADTLDQEGLSLNPVVLQLCAKLGELAGEDSLVTGSGSESREGILEQAKKLQATPDYWNNQEVFNKVAGLYKKAESLKR